MPRYKFELKVRDEYTAFDYRTETTITKRNKTVVAPTYAEAREKIRVYLGQFNVSDYTAKIIKTTSKESILSDLSTWEFPKIHIGY